LWSGIEEDGRKPLLLLSLFPSFRALLHKGFHGKAVAIGTKPCDDALAHGTDERSVAKSLAGMHIAQVHFHHWQRSYATDGIAQCHRSVGVGTSIKHHTCHITLDRCLLEGIDEGTFVVRLESGNLHASSKLLLQSTDDVIERSRAIDGGFSATEKIEVRSVDYKYFHTIMRFFALIPRTFYLVCAGTKVHHNGAMWRNCRIFVCKITKSQVILKTRAIKLLIISFMNDSSSELSKPQVADTSALLEKYRLFLLLEQGLSENTRMAYQRDVERFLEFLAEVNTPVLEVRLPLLHEYTQHLFALGVAARSMARMLSGVRSFYRFLQLDGHLAQDPTELLESPRIPKHLPAVLSLEEVEAILGAIDQSKPEGQRDHALLELLYSCGLRVSEVCTLKLSDLFLDEGFIRVTGKGDKQRIVPISPRAIHELHNWFDARANIAVKPEDEDFVFVSPSRGRHLSRITVFHNIKQYVQAANIDKVVSPHTFRHTFATHLLEGGASLRAIQVMLGHENIGTTEIYTHLDSRFLRQQVLEHFPRNRKTTE